MPRKVAPADGGAAASSASASSGLEAIEMTLDTSEVSRRLRARKLAGLATKEINPRTMRTLFRLCDEDNSHEVSPAEIQRALVLLGFPTAKDPVALSRLLIDIDEDKTGVVSEGEFMAFMGNTSRDALRERLNGYVVGRCFVKATIWGRKGSANFSSTEVVQPAQLREWLGANLRGVGKRVWLDVCGFDAASYQVIADAVGVSLTELTTCSLFQAPGLAMLPKLEAGGKSSSSSLSRTFAGVEREARARFVMHLLTPSTNPLVGRDFSAYDYMPAALAELVSAVTGYEILEPSDRTTIVGYSSISSAPPAISVEQVAMLCVNERTILTLHAPVFDAAEPDLSRLRAGGGDPDEDPLCNDGSGLYSLFNGLREQLAESSPAVGHLFKGSAKGLAVVIADMVMAHNFEMRDLMEDWDGILTKDIKKGPGKKHMFHIGALEALAKSMRSALEPVIAALDPADWDVPADASEEERAAVHLRVAATLRARTQKDNEREKAKGHGTLETLQGDERLEDEAAAPPPNSTGGADALAITFGRGASSMNVASAGGGGGGSAAAGGDEGAAASATAPAAAATPMLRIFFEKQLSEFAELTNDARGVSEDMDGKVRKAAELYKLIESMQSDMMNRTLYALTLVTVMVLPFSILTGIFGMNFTDMAELDPMSASGGEGELGPSLLPITGYNMFWTILGSLLTVLTYGFLRFSLLKPLTG